MNASPKRAPAEKLTKKMRALFICFPIEVNIITPMKEIALTERTLRIPTSHTICDAHFGLQLDCIYLLLRSIKVIGVLY
jgi:hypothetical protein